MQAAAVVVTFTAFNPSALFQLIRNAGGIRA